jgi:hypothetical protein
MTLSPGTRLGPYEVQAAIDAGGAGEQYGSAFSGVEHLEGACAMAGAPAIA